MSKQKWIGEDGPQEIWVFLDQGTNVTGYSETGPELASRNERAVHFIRAPQWQPIESAPEKVRVQVCGGDTPNKVSIAVNDPDRYTPWHESHAALPRVHAWYSETTRGSGKIWPAPTHWQPLPAPPEAV